VDGSRARAGEQATLAAARRVERLRGELVTGSVDRRPFLPGAIVVSIGWLPWCVVTTTETSASNLGPGTCRHAVMIQRVRVPPRQAPERRVADPGQVPRGTWIERGDESLIRGESRATGSKRAGRNIK
jgi:hypothetical protein